ncbi:MAG: hypothetical protein R3200_12280 [Xanthomonadales bacterium]|nr:hypothetical protein [Xanthomonadales bacterium]
MTAAAGAQPFDIADVTPPPEASAQFGASIDGAGGLVAVGDPGAERVFVFRREGSRLVLDGQVLPDRLSPATGFGAVINLNLSRTRIFEGGGHYTLAVGAPDVDSFEIFIRCQNGQLPDQTFPPRPGTDDPGFFAPRPCRESGWASFDALIPGSLSFSAGDTGIGTGIQFENDTIYVGAPRGLREDELEEPYPDGVVIILDYYRLAALGTMELSQSTAGTFLTPPAGVTGKGATSADFGAAVSVNNGKLSVGAPSANLAAGLVGLYQQIASNLEDPLNVQTVSTTEGPAAFSEFGASVSLDSSLTVAVGSPGIDQGAVTLLQFDDPNASLALDVPADASNFGTSVKLAGNLAIIGALAGGKPTAILRTVFGGGKGVETRLNGDQVASANRQIFSAADSGAGTVQAALDSEVLFANGLEISP